MTPLVEPMSLDEAYLDVTENTWNEPLGMTVAERIKDRIREVTSLTASAGVAPNKFLAKIASGWKKPDGLTVIAPDRVESFLQKLPVDALWGVGPVTARQAARPGDRASGGRPQRSTSNVSVKRSEAWLTGSSQLSHGVDDRPVVPHRRHEITRARRTPIRKISPISR